MRTIVLFVVLSVPALAQPRPAPDASCVDVRIGDARYYDCVNREMEQAVPNRRFSTQDAPLGVQAPANVVGTFNQAATAEQLGSNFGKSVTPERPPQSPTSSSLLRR